MMPGLAAATTGQAAAERGDQQPRRVEGTVPARVMAHRPGEHGDPGQAARVGDPGCCRG